MESAATPTERDTRAAARSSAHSSSSSDFQDSDSAIADTSSTTPNPTSSALTPAQLLDIIRDLQIQIHALQADRVRQDEPFTPVRDPSAAHVSQSSDGYNLRSDMPSSVRLNSSLHPEKEKRTRIAERDYTSTSSHVSDGVKALRLSANGQNQDINRKFEKFDNFLDATNLLTLKNGTRLRPPVPTDENPMGFLESYMAIPNDPSTIVRADDWEHFKYDVKRLFQIMQEFFHESLHFVCTEAVKNGDGITMFKMIHKELCGNRAKDVDTANKALENFILNPSKALASEIQRLEDAFLKVDYASETKMTDKARSSRLRDLIMEDPREILKHIVASPWPMDSTYYQMRDRLIDTMHNLSAKYHTVKMAAFQDRTSTTSSLGVCYR